MICLSVYLFPLSSYCLPQFILLHLDTDLLLLSMHQPSRPREIVLDIRRMLINEFHISKRKRRLNYIIVIHVREVRRKTPRHKTSGGRRIVSQSNWKFSYSQLARTSTAYEPKQKDIMQVDRDRQDETSRPRPNIKPSAR